MTEKPRFDQFKNICFLCTGASTDGGAFERAVHLSRHSGARLSVLSLIHEPPAGLRSFLSSWGAAPERIDYEQKQNDQVQRLVEQARQQGVRATGTMLKGTGLDIVRQVIRDQHDLLVKAAHPTEVVRRVLFGHTDRQLIRKCPCPVWINKTDPKADHDRILAAIDLEPLENESDQERDREQLNALILQCAIVIAQAEQAELHVLHVWPFDLEGPLDSRAGMSAESISQIGEAIKQKHNEALHRVIRPYRQHIAEVHLIKGQAEHEIPQFVTSQSVDLVVMGTLSRSGVAGLLIGNTAETVLDQIDCSLLAMKPPGFTSPVKG